MIDSSIQAKYEAEIHRLQDELSTLEPGTEAYNAVQTELMKAMEVMTEMVKVNDARKGAKVDTTVKVVTFAGGLVLAPVIETVCKRYLAGFIGKVEQMETFTSSAGRGISSWFRWK